MCVYVCIMALSSTDMVGKGMYVYVCMCVCVCVSVCVRVCVYEYV